MEPSETIQLFEGDPSDECRNRYGAWRIEGDSFAVAQRYARIRDEYLVRAISTLPSCQTVVKEAFKKFM